MTTESRAHESAEAPVTFSRRRTTLIVLATIGICAIAVILVQRPVSHWLAVRSAYRKLSHDDQGERTDALRWLVSNGENPDESLIALLGHSDEGVRYSAAYALSSQRPMTDRTIELFLVDVESASPKKAVEQSASGLFYRYGEQAKGPLTPTDQRIIAWLVRRLHSKIVHESEGAAMALTTFVHRDPTLNYLNEADLEIQYSVARKFARVNPSYRDKYLRQLLAAASSANAAAEQIAIQHLKELQKESSDFVAELETRRSATSDPQEASRLDRAIEVLKPTASHEE